MNAWKLRFSMVGTLALIFGLSTLVFTAILTYFEIQIGLLTIGVFVLIFNIAQWLLSPYLVGAIYRVKEMAPNEHPELHQMIEQLSIKSKISKPKLMLARIPLPNAFAYGSPLSGNRVAVTEGLLKSLDSGEVEAVIGHELGHLKHRDVQVMMAVSFLPALFYYIGYSLMLSGMFGGSRDRNNQGNTAIIGILFMVFSWILTLFTLYLSRLREYYADRHSVSIVDNGAEKLSTGLVTIVNESKNQQNSRRGNEQKSNTAFKSLFISNPDNAAADAAELNSKNFTNKRELLRETLARKPTGADNFAEIFSTHPNIIKRLHALQEQNKAA